MRLKLNAPIVSTPQPENDNDTSSESDSSEDEVVKNLSGAVSSALPRKGILVAKTAVTAGTGTGTEQKEKEKGSPSTTRQSVRSSEAGGMVGFSDRLATVGGGEGNKEQNKNEKKEHVGSAG